MADISRDEFNERMDRLHDTMERGFGEINGRLRKTETDIAVIQAVNGKDPAARYAGIGGIATAVGTFVYQWFSSKP